MNAGTWILAAAVSFAAHVSFAAWLDARQPAKKPARPAIEMRLAARPKPMPKLVEPPPPPPPEPIKKPVVRKVIPKPTPAAPAPPPPEAQKVGIDENATSKDGLAFSTGGTLEGEMGTGNTMAKAPPAPEPAPAPPAPAPAPQGKRFVPEYKVSKLPMPRSAIHPELPAAFREANREARLTLEVEIDETGHVVHAKLIGKDEFGLAAAVLAAVEHTEFEPALVGTQPVPVRYHLPLTLRVHG
jgi:outer membrane biosynthesis protein TonB